MEGCDWRYPDGMQWRIKVIEFCCVGNLYEHVCVSHCSLYSDKPWRTGDVWHRCTTIGGGEKLKLSAGLFE